MTSWWNIDTELWPGPYGLIPPWIIPLEPIETLEFNLNNPVRYRIRVTEDCYHEQTELGDVCHVEVTPRRILMLKLVNLERQRGLDGTKYYVWMEEV